MRNEVGTVPATEAKKLILVVPSRRQMVSVVRAALAEMLRKTGCGPKEIEDIKLAVNEACANVIEHAYQGREDGVVILRVSVETAVVTVRIRDFGRKIDPKSLKSRKLDELKPSGIGIYLMKKLMDEVEYDHTHAVGTELTLVKQRSWAEVQPF